MAPFPAKKSKKKKKKDRSKSKCKPDFLLHDGCSETAIFTQMHQSKKKAKKKNKLEDDVQQVRKSKSKKHLKQPHTKNMESVTYISPNQEVIHSTESVCHRCVKDMVKDRSKKSIIFNLPPEQSQTTKAKDEDFAIGQLDSSAISVTTRQPVCSGNMSNGKQLVVDSISKSQAEEINSQDLFITQKSFLDPYSEFSSSASRNETRTVTELANRSCRLTTEAATQTESFFTYPELSNSLRFQQKQNTSMFTEEPMDLSMPNRARQTPSSIVSAKYPTEDYVNLPKLKISDTSSEDGDVVSKVKGDLTQLKVIQTRLNESFFFKVKGDDSPKPICSLMKLKETKIKK